MDGHATKWGVFNAHFRGAFTGRLDIDADHPRRGMGSQLSGPDQPQQRVAADRHGQPLCQARSGLAAQGKADVALDAAQARGSSRPWLCDLRQALGEDPVRAAHACTAEPSRSHWDDDSTSCQGRSARVRV